MVDTFYDNKSKLKGKPLKVEINGIEIPIDIRFENEYMYLPSNERITIKYEEI